MRTEEILHISALQRGDAPAVIDIRGNTSYRELLRLSESIAHSLKNAQVPPNSLIGLSILNAREFLAALFGVMKAGCVAIPISPQLPAAEQQRVIAETGVSYSLTLSANADLLPHEVSPDFGDLVGLSLRKEPSVAGAIARHFSDAAVVRHTSGTTARSKGVVISHTGVLERTTLCMRLLDVTESDVVLAPLPLAYHFVASALSFLRAGATIIDCAGLSPLQTLELGARHNATMAYASPLQYELLSRTAHEYHLTTLRRAFSTSALLPATTARLFQARFGIRLTQVYGVIEVGLPLWNIDPADAPTLLGRCPAPYECAVVNDDGSAVPRGEIGELIVRGPGLFSGYLSGAGSERTVARDGWFHTGDLVSENDGGGIAYKGRKKSVINCAGNKIFPEEVEAVLRQAPDILNAHVFAEPHPLLGDIVVAEIVPTSNSEADQGSWRNRCYSQLSGFKVPKEFRVVSSLQMTGSGKIIRHTPELEEEAA
jgi:long-chain acyl-CoA synthetase